MKYIQYSEQSIRNDYWKFEDGLIKYHRLCVIDEVNVVEYEGI